MSATTTNGKPQRKQLADQLDRLDALIDTLGGGLNAAVADACREGARAAVREVLLELIANPDLVAAVRPAGTTAPSPPPAAPAERAPVEPSAPSVWTRVKATATSARRAVTGAAHTLTQSVRGAVTPATAALTLTGTTRAVVAVALGVGLAAGAVSLVCPAWVGALVTAGAGASAVAAAHVGATVHRIWATFRLT